MDIRICKHCNKQFVAKSPKQEFCNHECKYSYYNVYYKCDNCGENFLTKRHLVEKIGNGRRKHLYCSKCTNNGMGASNITKKCTICGKEFTVPKSLSEQKYCSKECSYLGAVKYNDIECPVCKRTFHPKDDTTIYCSNECKFEAARDRVKCVCHYCGKEFERKRSEVVKNNRHYCSFDCKLSDIKWSQADISLLRKYYGKINIKDLQRKLSKQWKLKAIKAKSQILGLGKDRMWSDKEIAILKEYYPKITMFELLELLPNRTLPSIKGKARVLGIKSKFSAEVLYSKGEIDYLQSNYLKQTNEELADNLGNNRTANGISQKLRFLGLFRPYEIKKDGYTTLQAFVRERLTSWRNEVRESSNYTCCLTGFRSNIVVHHCRGFSILFQETIDALNFQIKDNFSDYNDEELLAFVSKFTEIQDYYNSFVCVTEDIHKMFHKMYGYGDNTEEQWDEFVYNYKIGKYRNIA